MDPDDIPNVETRINGTIEEINRRITEKNAIIERFKTTINGRLRAIIVKIQNLRNILPPPPPLPPPTPPTPQIPGSPQSLDQSEIDRLRSENEDIRRTYFELRESYKKLSGLVGYCEDQVGKILTSVSSIDTDFVEVERNVDEASESRRKRWSR